MSSIKKPAIKHNQIWDVARDAILLRRLDARIIALSLGVAAVVDTIYVLFGINAATLTVVTLMAVTAAMVVTAMIKNRLARVSTALDDITAGRLDYRLEVKGADAMSRLSRTFNNMASTMELGMAELRQERNRIRSIHQGITDGILVFDRLGRVVSSNPAAEVAIGRLERDILGRWDIGLPEIEKMVTAADLVPDMIKVRCREAKACTHPECPSFDSEDLRCWLQCGTYCHNEIQGTFSEKRDACERCDVYQKNGIAHTTISVDSTSYAVSISPILNQQGHEEGRIAVLHDITEISTAREKLERKNQELALMNDVALTLAGSLDKLDGVIDETIEKVMNSVSTSAAAILQVNPQTGAVNRNWSRGFPPQVKFLLQMSELDLATAHKSGDHVLFVSPESIFLRSRGLMGALERSGLQPSVAIPLRHRGSINGVMILAGGKCCDLSPGEASLIGAVSANIGVAIQNQELYESVIKAKQAWEATFDSMVDAVSFHDPDFNIVRVNTAMSRFTEQRPEDLVGRKCYEVVHGLDAPPAHCQAHEVLRTGRSLSSEVIEDYLGRTFRITINPVRNGQGETIGVVHVMKDITERKLLREQLLQSEKMAAVGQLVSGVAHELNNPLTGVLGFSQLLMRKCTDDVKELIGSDVEAIANEAQRASRIVQNLLSFARKHKAQKTMVDINDAIQTVFELKAYDLKVRNINIETSLDPELPRTMADQHQVEQVLLNMVNNAEQAIVETGKAGRIVISSSVREGAIEIVVCDNGAGIPSEKLGRIFDPFFTTKEVGQGTGLGLSICYGIVEEHAGEIKVDSNSYDGTTFTVVLPVTEWSVVSSPSAPESGEADEGRRRILVVDDEPAIVDLLTDILTMEGHGVDIARNGKLALEKLGAIHYDNIITDIKMPEMDGKELHRRISEIDPQLAANVIFITGDSIGNDTREFLRDTGNIFLAKPFNIHELRERLHKVMNGYE